MRVPKTWLLFQRNSFSCNSFAFDLIAESSLNRFVALGVRGNGLRLQIVYGHWCVKTNRMGAEADEKEININQSCRWKFSD